MRISSPPISWPCFYGIDFATRAELIATGLAVEEIRASIQADSLGFLSMERMIAATEQPENRLCTECFTGSYPIPLPPAERLGKYLLEQSELPLGAPEDGLASLAGGPGGAGALEQPLPNRKASPTRRRESTRPPATVRSS